MSHECRILDTSQIQTNRLVHQSFDPGTLMGENSKAASIYCLMLDDGTIVLQITATEPDPDLIHPDEYTIMLPDATAAALNAQIEAVLQRRDNVIVGYLDTDYGFICVPCQNNRKGLADEQLSKVYIENLRPYSQKCYCCNEVVYKGTTPVILFEKPKRETTTGEQGTERSGSEQSEEEQGQ